MGVWGPKAPKGNFPRRMSWDKKRVLVSMVVRYNYPIIVKFKKVAKKRAG